MYPATHSGHRQRLKILYFLHWFQYRLFSNSIGKAYNLRHGGAGQDEIATTASEITKMFIFTQCCEYGAQEMTNKKFL